MSSPLMKPLQFGETTSTHLLPMATDDDIVPNTSDDISDSKVSGWNFTASADEQQHVDEQMCQLIDNLAVSNLLYSIDGSSALGHNSPSSSSTTSIRGRTDSSDSGVGDCGDTFVVPDQQQIDAILARLEAYFSDDHLRTDTFLLKHIRRSKEGFVSLKLVSSFQKMKSLTKDWRVVAHCIRHHSKELQLNESGSKVRRIAALPDDILQLPITKKKSTNHYHLNQNNHHQQLRMHSQAHPWNSSDWNDLMISGLRDSHGLSGAFCSSPVSSACASSSSLNTPAASCTQLLEQLERRWPRILFAFEPAATLHSPATLMSTLRSYCERFGALVGLKLLRPERALRLEAVRRTLTARSVDLRQWRQLSALVEFSSVEQAQQVLQLQQFQSSATSRSVTSLSLHHEPQSMWPAQFQFCALHIRPIDVNSLHPRSAEPAFPIGRLRNRSDVGPIERIRFDSFDPLSENNQSSASSMMLMMNNHISPASSASRLTLNDSFDSFDSLHSLYSFGPRPRASTISHFGDWGSNRSNNRSSPTSTSSNNPSSIDQTAGWQIDNRRVNPIGPIARPKSNSVSAQDQGHLMANVHSTSSNLLRLPKGPDAHASGFDYGNRSRSTSSPSAIMQLFSFP